LVYRRIEIHCKRAESRGESRKQRAEADGAENREQIVNSKGSRGGRGSRERIEHRAESTE
jgi:hypothetical protein